MSYENATLQAQRRSSYCRIEIKENDIPANDCLFVNLYQTHERNDFNIPRLHWFLEMMSKRAPHVCHFFFFHNLQKTNQGRYQ